MVLIFKDGIKTERYKEESKNQTKISPPRIAFVNVFWFMLPDFFF